MKSKWFVPVLLAALFAAGPMPAVSAADDGAALLTIFLRHDQSKNLGEIEERLRQTGFWEKFPPEGVEVVSWYIMMGVGHVVTLRVPPGKLREVNLAIEKNAWGAFRTEFYPTYDYVPIWREKTAAAEPSASPQA